MTWYDGLSSLKGQISNFTKEIVAPTLLPDSEEDQSEKNKYVQELEAKCKELQSEVERLQQENKGKDVEDGAGWDWKVLDDASEAGGAWADEDFQDVYLGQDGPQIEQNDVTIPRKQLFKICNEKNKLEQKCTFLEEERTSTMKELHDIKASFSELHSRQNTTRLTQQTQTASVEIAGPEVQRLQEELNQLESERVQLRSELTSVRRVVQDLESQVAVTRDDNANLSTGMEELDIQHQEAIEQIMVLKNETCKKYEELLVEHEELKAKYEAKLEAEKEYSAKLVNPNIASSASQTDKEIPLPNSESELQSRLEDTFASEIKNVLQEISISDEYFDNCDNKPPYLRSVIALVNMLKDSLRSKKKTKEDLSKLNSKLQETEDELEALESENIGLQENVERLTKQSQSLPPILENSEELEALDRKANSLEKEVNVLIEVRSNLEVELGTCRNEISSLRQQLQVSQAMIKNQDNLHNEVALLQDRERTLSSMLESVTSVNEVLKTENEGLKSLKSQDVENKIRDLQQKYEKEIEKEKFLNIEISQNFKSLKEEIENLKQNEDALIESCSVKDDKLRNLETNYNNAFKKMSSLETRCMELDENILSLNLEKESMERKMCELILEKSASDKELETMKETFNKQNDTLSNFEKLCNVKDEDLLSFESQIKELNQNIEFKNSDIEALNNENKVFKLEISELNDKIKSFESEEKCAIEGMNDKHLLQLKELQDSCEKLAVEYNRLKTEKDEINSLYAELQVAHIASSKKCNEMENSMKASEHSNSSFQQTITEIENKLLHSEESVVHLQNEKQSLLEQLNNLHSELNDKTDCLQKLSLQTKENESVKAELETRCNALENELKETIVEFEESKKYREKHEMALESLTKLSQTILGHEKEKEVWQQRCRELEVAADDKLPQLLVERDQLITSLQAKHAESLEYHAEIQRLNKLLTEEMAKTSQMTADVSNLSKTYTDVKMRMQEKEEAIQHQHKEIMSLRQQVETLQNQLEYASQLLRIDDRQEAEGQPSTTDKTSDQDASNANEKNKEYVLQLEMERNQLAESVLQEQTRNKYLQNEVQEHHEKEMSLARELERLRSHLVSVEDNYTQEMVKAENQVKDLHYRLSHADERVKNSSTAYTSASIRANQQVEALQAQMKVTTEQRDRIQLQLSGSEDKVQKQAAALQNLQIVLEQFQRDKEKDISLETERIKQNMMKAQQRSEDLKEEIISLQGQLGEAKEGLSAAARLGEQIERKDQTISDMKIELQEIAEKLHKAEEKLKATNVGVEGKVDRYLVKNLLVGYLSAPPQNRIQALRVLATVVDLTIEERQRIGLEAGSSSDMLKQQSLSEAFVRFLENESRPQPHLRLTMSDTKSTEPKSRRSSATSTPSVLLSDAALPNLPQFPTGRSGSILKDVLKDDRLL